MNNLRRATESIGKPEWRPMLRFVAELHERSVHPAQAPFPHPWEEIGPGYCYGPAFGHWDIVHAILDVLPFEPEHAQRQILNNLAAQQDDGLVPGAIWLRGDEPEWDTSAGHPPVWPFVVEAHEAAGGPSLVEQCFNPLARAGLEQHDLLGRARVHAVRVV